MIGLPKPKVVLSKKKSNEINKLQARLVKET